jgi:hypothetical protein
LEDVGLDVVYTPCHSERTILDQANRVANYNYNATY